MGSYDEGVPKGTLFSASTTSGALSTKTTPIDPSELLLTTLPLRQPFGSWSAYHVTVLVTMLLVCLPCYWSAYHVTGQIPESL